MRIEGGYCCDYCSARLVDDIELDARQAHSWAAQTEHVCVLCVFGIEPDNKGEGDQ